MGSDSKITPTMKKALALFEGERLLVRQYGGYWTINGAELDWESGRWVGPKTVRALLAAGLVEDVSVPPTKLNRVWRV